MQQKHAQNTLSVD